MDSYLNVNMIRTFMVHLGVFYSQVAQGPVTTESLSF